MLPEHVVSPFFRRSELTQNLSVHFSDSVDVRVRGSNEDVQLKPLKYEYQVKFKILCTFLGQVSDGGVNVPLMMQIDIKK